MRAEEINWEVYFSNSLYLFNYSSRESGQGTGTGHVASPGELRPDEGGHGGEEEAGGGETDIGATAATAAK